MSAPDLLTHGEPGTREPVDTVDSPPIVLTVIIPAYNEAATIVPLLEKVAAAAYEKQIVVVDDGSRDGTPALVEDWRTGLQDPVRVELLAHEINRGKGAAIRTGLAAARGEVTLIQDADLEYDPDDYPRLVGPILTGEAEVVYGSRYLSKANYLPWTANRLCVHLLNGLVRVLYRQRITDEATCYKVFRTDLLRRIDLRCERFEFCPEVTAKVSRLGVRIREVPIRYHPRFADEGKKIGWRDGVEAVWTLLRWRFRRWRPQTIERTPDSSPADRGSPGQKSPATDGAGTSM
ncbi:MAG: glycosyltransferase family 2 protein [Planctomycetaceae bacterium]